MSEMSVGGAIQMLLLLILYIDTYIYIYSTSANIRLVEPGNPVLQRHVTQATFPPLM